MLRLPRCEDIVIDPGDILIDCGANVGDITSLFARTGAMVYAFEPHPLCWSILSRRFSMLRNVECYQSGVMDRDEKLTFRIPAAHDGFDDLDASIGASFIEGAMRTDRYSVAEQEVACVDLDKFIRGLGRRVRILKLDVEGAEIPILNKLLDTGTFGLIDFLLVEPHDWLMPSLKRPTAALRERISAAGYPTKVKLDWQVDYEDGFFEEGGTSRYWPQKV